MENTLEESLRSVLNQVDGRFEVIIVDGGSTDGSISILDRLKDIYSNLRVILLPNNPQRSLGTDRHISIKNANGQYVLTHIDCDDRFEEGIVPFSEIYHQIHQQVDFDFGMVGSHITIAPRDFILEIGSYRPIKAGEDPDLWRRMIAEDAFIILDCIEFWEELGYEKSIVKKLKRVWNQRVAEFQCGMSYTSKIKSTLLYKGDPEKFAKDLIISTAAYTISRFKPQYPMPGNMSSYSNFFQEIENRTMSLPEIEQKYGIEINGRNMKGDIDKIF